MNRPHPPELDETLAALRANDLAHAQALCQRWIARDAQDVRAHGLLARALNLDGDDEGARAAIAAALSLDAAFVPAWIEAAALAKRTHAHTDAVAALRKLLSWQPTRATLQLDLALSLRALGDGAAATEAAHQAWQLDPNLAAAAELYGALCYDAGDYAAALPAQLHYARLQPGARDAWTNLGETLIRLKRHTEALEAFRHAERIDPRSAQALDGQSRCVLSMQGDIDDWLSLRERLAQIDDDAPAYTRLGMDCWKAARYGRARAAFERAIERAPEYLPSRWGASQYPQVSVYRHAEDMLRFREDWLAGLAWFEQREFRQVHPSQLVSSLTMATNFYLHYLGEAMVEEQVRYARVIERMVAPLVERLDAPPARPRSDARIRIGVCSGFFRQHTIMKLFSGLLDALPRERFERSVFYLSDLDNGPTRHWRERADFFAMGERDIPTWVREIQQRDLDLLLYLDIGMHPLAQTLAALRLAPRQAVLWGHPTTSGFRHIDEFWSSALMELPDAQTRYRERLMLLPGLGAAFTPPSTTPKVPAELTEAGRDGKAHAFFAQAAYKILPPQDRALARIAAQAPQVVFHMTPFPKSAVRQALRERMAAAFAEHGQNLDAHLGIYRFVDETEFLGIASRVDFALDALGWSGGNTAFEIFAYDVPTVTLPGTLMRSRHTYAMLKLMELDELIARDEDDYVRIAVRLAHDADWRLSLRERIRERKHRLYDHRETCTAFVALCERAALTQRST